MGKPGLVDFLAASSIKGSKGSNIKGAKDKNKGKRKGDKGTRNQPTSFSDKGTSMKGDEGTRDEPGMPSMGIGKSDPGSLGKGKGNDEQEPSGAGMDNGKRDQPSGTGKNKAKAKDKHNQASSSSMTAQQWGDSAILEYLDPPSSEH